MTYRQPARPTNRPIRIRTLRVVGLLVLVATGAVLGHRVLASSSWMAESTVEVPHGASASRNTPRPVWPPGTTSRLWQHRRALGEADGAVPDGTTVFDDAIPGVAKLDPALLGALRQASIDAADDGVEFLVDSGWRSRRYQERLLQEAVSKYGSEEEAARWVATPDTSPHVSGDAVDIGPSDAAAWLSEHGAEYGLCQIYSNERWHFELRPKAINQGCPPMYADPTQDPRMQ